MDDGGDVECHAAMGAGAYRLFLSLLLGTTLEIFLHDSIAFFCRPSAIERSLMNIARCCGLGGTSRLSRAFRARFGLPPRQYLVPVRQQDLDWHEARLITDGFDQDAFYGGNRGWAPLRHMEPGMLQSRSSPVIPTKLSEIPNPPIHEI
jgi:hypothetical protein